MRAAAPCSTSSSADPLSAAALGARVHRLELLLQEQYSEILEAVTELHGRLDRQYGYLQLLEGRIWILQITIQTVICRADCTDEPSSPHLDLHSLD